MVGYFDGGPKIENLDGCGLGSFCSPDGFWFIGLVTFSFNRASLTGFCGVDFGAGTGARESLESAIVKGRKVGNLVSPGQSR